MTDELKPEWFCKTCGQTVPPQDVTFEETHDVRHGGCGDFVNTRTPDEPEPVAWMVLNRNGRFVTAAETYDEALLFAATCGASVEVAPAYTHPSEADELLRRVSTAIENLGGDLACAEGVSQLEKVGDAIDAYLSTKESK